MTRKELQEYLNKYPEDMNVKIHYGKDFNNKDVYTEFTPDNIHTYSDTAYKDIFADEDEWDLEDGKLELGSGERYIMFTHIVY